MPRPTKYARIAVTLPRTDLAAADRLARAHDRSRSWIVAEAIRRFAAATGEIATNPSRASIPDAVTTLPADERTSRGLGPSRLTQLTRDLALTPEERVRAAEETLLMSAPEPKAHRVVAFDRYEDFLDWQRTRDRAR